MHPYSVNMMLSILVTTHVPLLHIYMAAALSTSIMSFIATVVVCTWKQLWLVPTIAPLEFIINLTEMSDI